MSDIENLIARLRKQADNAGAVMDRIADQGSIEDGDTWAVDEHVEAYELAEVATMAIATLEAVTAERDEARAQVAVLQAKADLPDREQWIEMLSEMGRWATPADYADAILALIRGEQD